MPTDLRAASRHQHLVLYDPAAVPADAPFDPDLATSEPDPLPAEALQSLAVAGQALVLHYPTPDCEATLRLFVDEEPPASLRERARTVISEAPLHLPTGQAVADGAEFLAPAGLTREHSEAGRATVAPGTYTVSVLNLLPWKVAHRDALLEQGTTRAERAVERVLLVFTIFGAALFPINLFAFPVAALVIGKRYGMRAALTAVAIMVAFDLLILLSFAVLGAARRRFPILDRANALRGAFESENPDVAVVLRRGAPPAPVPAAATLRWDDGVAPTRTARRRRRATSG